MLTAVKEMSHRAERVEPTCRINWAALDRIRVWREPVGETQPDQPILLQQVYPDGKRELLYLEPRYQLSDEYNYRLN